MNRQMPGMWHGAACRRPAICEEARAPARTVSPTVADLPERQTQPVFPEDLEP
jgi:hypothetical protein